MKFFIIIFLITIFSCTYKKVAEEAGLYVEDTELAEIKRANQITKEDSLELLKTFHTFCQALSKGDGILISKMSADNKAWPPSLNRLLNILPGYPSFLLTWPCKNLYKEDIWKMMNYWRPTISHYYGFDITFTSFKKTKQSDAEIEYKFSFVKLDGKFKFDTYKEVEMIRWNLYPSIDSITAYFPKTGTSGLGGQKKDFLSNFENIWYSKALNSCSEPLLYNYKGNEEIYRFSWFPSFHMPVVIRIQKNGFDFSLSAKELRQGYGDEPDCIWNSNERSMNFFQWQSFKNKLDDAKFWDMPFKDEEVGMDGAIWVLEAYKNGRYRMIQRWSPRTTDFGNACEYLISISGLGIDRKHIY